jgi:hypothetical protein
MELAAQGEPVARLVVDWGVRSRVCLDRAEHCRQRTATVH